MELRCLPLFFFLGKENEIRQFHQSVSICKTTQYFLFSMNILQYGSKNDYKFLSRTLKLQGTGELCNTEKSSPKSWAPLHTSLCWYANAELWEAIHEMLLRVVELQMKKITLLAMWCLLCSFLNNVSTFNRKL